MRKHADEHMHAHTHTIIVKIAPIIAPELRMCFFPPNATVCLHNGPLLVNTPSARHLMASPRNNFLAAMLHVITRNLVFQLPT